MSSDRVTGERYFEKEESGIRAGCSGGTEAGTTETEPPRVTRRCTECGRRGHNASNTAVHPHLAHLGARP